MKVSTRIIAGYVILILLTVAALAYQVYTIRELKLINDNLSQVNVENSLKSLQLQYDELLIEEWAQKYYGTGDKDYKDLFDDAGNDLEMDLMGLQPTVNTEAEREAIRKVFHSWKAVQEIIGAERKQRIDTEVTVQLTNQLEALRAETVTLSGLSKTAILNAASLSAKTASGAGKISVYAAVGAILLTILVSVPIVWSITSRLRELGTATREVAAGQFEHRMAAGGSDEFASLAGDFNTMAQRLGELDQMKKDFVSHVSHDLKGPLASTRETVHILLEEIPGPLNEKQRRLLALCLKSSERLSGMIGNLLDVSRMEAGMMDYKIESFDLVPLARGAASELEGLAREKKLDIVVESAVPEIRIDGDQGRITQVISNLLENAIKFSPASGRALVRIEAKGEYAVLSVWDRGPGVPILSRTRIFDRFHQVNPGRKIAGQGVGLGLAICRTIVEAHGGTIWVEGNPGGGSVFYMQIKSSERIKA